MANPRGPFWSLLKLSATRGAWAICPFTIKDSRDDDELLFQLFVHLWQCFLKKIQQKGWDFSATENDDYKYARVTLPRLLQCYDFISKALCQTSEFVVSNDLSISRFISNSLFWYAIPTKTNVFPMILAFWSQSWSWSKGLIRDDNWLAPVLTDCC